MPPRVEPARALLAEDRVPVDVARASAATRPCGRGRSSRRAARTPKPRSVKLRPLRTLRPTPSYGTQRTWRLVDAALEIRSSTQPSDRVVDERRDDGRAQAEAAAQPARDVVLAAALPRPGTSASCGCAPSPGSSRSITSPRLTRSQRHSDFGLISRLAMHADASARGSGCQRSRGRLSTLAPRRDQPSRPRTVEAIPFPHRVAVGVQSARCPAKAATSTSSDDCGRWKFVTSRPPPGSGTPAR